MEIALNLCWLMIAAALVGMWLRQPQFRGRPIQGRRQWLAGAMVLACVLFLVFPVISASDDVRSREFLEEPTSDQPLVKSLEVQKRAPLGQLATPVAALTQPQLGPGLLPTLGLVHVTDLPLAELAFVHPTHGRSPPCA